MKCFLVLETGAFHCRSRERTATNWQLSWSEMEVPLGCYFRAEKSGQAKWRLDAVGYSQWEKRWGRGLARLLVAISAASGRNRLTRSGILKGSGHLTDIDSLLFLRTKEDQRKQRWKREKPIRQQKEPQSKWPISSSSPFSRRAKRKWKRWRKWPSRRTRPIWMAPPPPPPPPSRSFPMWPRRRKSLKAANTRRPCPRIGI